HQQPRPRRNVPVHSGNHLSNGPRIGLRSNIHRAGSGVESSHAGPVLDAPVPCIADLLVVASPIGVYVGHALVRGLLMPGLQQIEWANARSTTCLGIGSTVLLGSR